MSYDENATQDKSLGKLAAALARAQRVMGGAAKDSKGNFGKYATLASVWEACREPLAANELSVAQFPSSDGAGYVSVRTLLLHSSGEALESDIGAKARDASPQAVGAVITYLRRYALAAMVGIAPEDDDAESAQPRQFRSSEPPAPVISAVVTSPPPPAMPEEAPVALDQEEGELTSELRREYVDEIQRLMRQLKVSRTQMAAWCQAKGYPDTTAAMDRTQLTVTLKYLRAKASQAPTPS